MLLLCIFVVAIVVVVAFVVTFDAEVVNVVIVFAVPIFVVLITVAVVFVVFIYFQRLNSSRETGGQTITRQQNHAPEPRLPTDNKVVLVFFL